MISRQQFQFLLLVAIGHLACSLAETEQVDTHEQETHEQGTPSKAQPFEGRRKRKRKNKLSFVSTFLDKLGFSSEAKTVLCALLLLGLFMCVLTARPARVTLIVQLIFSLSLSLSAYAGCPKSEVAVAVLLR